MGVAPRLPSAPRDGRRQISRSPARQRPPGTPFWSVPREAKRPGAMGQAYAMGSMRLLTVATNSQGEIVVFAATPDFLLESDHRRPALCAFLMRNLKRRF